MPLVLAGASTPTGARAPDQMRMPSLAQTEIEYTSKAVVQPLPLRSETEKEANLSRPAMPVGIKEWARKLLLGTSNFDGHYPAKVVFQIVVGRNGRASACRVLESSGHAPLDEYTCRAIVRYARFEPALDAQGRPITGSYSSSVTWKVGKPDRETLTPQQ